MKNKSLALAVITATALLSACSNADELDSASTGTDHIVDSNVPIRLTANNVTLTRGSVESDDNGQFCLDGIGVFCLATGNLTNDSKPIDWTNYNSGTTKDGYSVLMSNVKANVVTATDGSNSVEWADTNADYYYPMLSTHKYAFATYYPYVDDSTKVEYKKSTVVIAYDALDGTKDIIAGNAYSDEPKAYSASYFRTTTGAKLPQLEMEHLMARLTFSIIKDEADSLATDEIGVDSIMIDKMPKTATLTLGARTEATLLAEGNDTTYVLKDAGDKTLGATYYAKDTLTSVGQGILMPVTGGARQLRVILKSKTSGNTKEWISTLQPPDGTWLKGTSYNVKLTLGTEMFVSLKASLKQWEQGKEISTQN